jgi:hypothetical protein
MWSGPGFYGALALPRLEEVIAGTEGSGGEECSAVGAGGEAEAWADGSYLPPGGSSSCPPGASRLFEVRAHVG